MGELFDVIKIALWGDGSAIANQDVFNEMKLHAIAALPASCLQFLSLSSELEGEWKRFILQHISFNTFSTANAMLFANKGGTAFPIII